jgi:hypothetical protein
MARESTIGSVFSLEQHPTTPVRGDITAVTQTTAGGMTTTLATDLAAPMVGGYVVISGTGWRSIDSKTAHRISAVLPAETIPAVLPARIVIDTSTEMDTAPAAIGTSASVRAVRLIEVCFSEFGSESSKPGEVDVTTMCDTERRNVAGLSNAGSATFGGPLDLTDAGQIELIAAQKDGLNRALIWKTRSGQTGIMDGTVSSFAAGPQGVEQAVKFSGTFQISEAPTYLAPLAP